MLKKYLFLIVLTSAIKSPATAQICINKFTAATYKGSTYDTFTASIVTPNHDIIAAGGLYDYNKAAHIAKYSSKGSSIWSYQYNLDFYDFVKAIFFNKVIISDIVNTSDGGLILAGYVEQVLSPWGNPPPVKKWGLMAKLDKFGKVMWTKTVTKGGEMSFTNLCTTTDGDIIAYLATDNGPKKAPGDHSYNNVVRIAQNGDVKWSTFLFTYLFDAGGLGVNNKRAIVQASNKNIIIGDVVHKTIAVNGAIKEGNLHFFELDYNTGKVKWETSYEYPEPVSDTANVPDIVNAKVLPGGKLSFITTLYLPVGNTQELIKKGVNIITSKSGVIENVIAYVPADGHSCSIISAAIDKNNGNRTLHVDKNGKAVLINVNDNGQVVWQNGYNNEQGNFPFNCFSAGEKGYNVFMSNNNSKQFRLLITDENGVIDCANETAEFLAIPAALNYSHDSVVTNLDYYFEDKYYDYAHPLKRGDEYPLTQTIDCQQTIACCSDFIDKININNISICEGKSYMLPDSTIIQDSGLYNVTFKTSLGCDSIRYYKVSIDKDVSKLSVGNDTCINSNTTITLNATEGFRKYYWMNEPVKETNAFAITQAGKYFVRVENKCGSKTDSLEIFSQCDYPVQMPTAFTPNADLINDFFRITSFNKNKLLNFRIYDRWGKMVFQTNNPSKGWDGTFRNEPQGAGTYVYYLEMKGYSGNTLSHKGFVNLIR